MVARDPLRDLQRAAARAADHIAPGERAVRVVVVTNTGSKLDVPVLPCCCSKEGAPDSGAEGAVGPGWVIGERSASFDGRVMPVLASRLKLLKVLVESPDKLSAKELARLAFDRETDEENVRYHIKALRAELAKGLPEFEGEIIPGDGGYRLALR